MQTVRCFHQESSSVAWVCWFETDKLALFTGQQGTEGVWWQDCGVHVGRKKEPVEVSSHSNRQELSQCVHHCAEWVPCCSIRSTSASKCILPPRNLRRNDHANCAIVEFVDVLFTHSASSCTHTRTHACTHTCARTQHTHTHTCVPSSQSFLSPLQISVAPSLNLLPWRWYWVYAAKSSSRGPKKVWRLPVHDALPCKTTNWCHHQARKWISDLLAIVDSNKTHTAHVCLLCNCLFPSQYFSLELMKSIVHMIFTII